MKKIQQYIGALLLAGISAGSLSSCGDFLDVQSTGLVDQDRQFEDIQGFESAMYGIYASMAIDSLYGGDMSYRFVDVLGQNFGTISTLSNYNYYGTYDYTNSTYVEPTIFNVWSNMYKTIANINNIIIHVDEASFSHRELPYIKGECLGLRAFLHFDLTRLFAQDYIQAGTAVGSTRGIPYNTTFDLNNKPIHSLENVYKLILADLDAAEALLANDEVVNIETTATSNYMAGRAAFFNKYAVLATKARVYYTMGDYENAARYARRVIASSNFVINRYTSMYDEGRFPATNELIFGLHNTTMTSTIADLFVPINGATGSFLEGRRDAETLYNSASFTTSNTDYRFVDWFAKLSTGSFTFTRLIKSQSEITTSPLQGFTLIRLPEMYYILAESIYDSDQTGAIEALNTIRNSRGLENIDVTTVATKAAFLNELLNERRREMPGEGQIFYSLKHYNTSFTNYLGTTTYQPSSSIFVLPWPTQEREYGNQWGN